MTRRPFRLLVFGSVFVAAVALANPPTKTGDLDANGNITATGSGTFGTTLTIGGVGGPTWQSGASAPTGACVTGSMYSLTSNVSPGFYVCSSSAWLAVAGGNVSGAFTAGLVPVAAGASTLINSSIADNGSAVSTSEPFTASTVGLASGPSWSSGTTAPSGSCPSGSLYSLTNSTTPAFYVCANSSWLQVLGGSLGTSNTVAKFSASGFANSDITDDGTTITFGVNSTHTGTETVGQFIGTVITPSAVTGTVNDWAPTGLSTASTVVVTSSSGTVTLTGITGGVAGRRLRIRNGDASNNLNIASNNASSSAANRITGPWGTVSIVLEAGANSSVTIEYDGTSSRWRVVAFSSNDVPSLVVDSTVAIGGASGPTWSSGSTAPSGSCTSGSMYSRTAGSLAPGFYVCASSAWIAVVTSTGVTNSAGSGVVPVTIDNSGDLGSSSMSDDGTSVTLQGLKSTTCAITTTTVLLNWTIPASCTFVYWTPTVNTQIVGIAPPSSGSRHITVYQDNSSGGNVIFYSLNSNATTTAWQIDNTFGTWLTTNALFTLDYNPTDSKWDTSFATNVGTEIINGSLGVTSNETLDGDLEFPANVDNYIIDLDAANSGTQNLNIDSAGPGGIIRFNSNTGSLNNSGTGGVLIESGGSSPETLALFDGSDFEILYNSSTNYGAGTSGPQVFYLDNNVEIKNNQSYSSNSAGDLNVVDTSSINTTSASFTHNAASIASNVTKSGSHTLTNEALSLDATGGDVNDALIIPDGDIDIVTGALHLDATTSIFGTNLTISTATLILGNGTSSAISFTDGPTGINTYAGKTLEYVDEFETVPSLSNSAETTVPFGSHGYYCQAVGSSTTSTTLKNVSSASGRPGVVQVDTGTTTSVPIWGGCWTDPNGVDFAGGTWTDEESIMVPTLATSTNVYQVLSGFWDTTASANQTDGCFFLIDQQNVATGGANTGKTNNLECGCASNSSRQFYTMDGSTVSGSSFTTVAAPVVAGTWLRLRVIATSSSVEFDVNGVKSCVVTADIPSGTSRVEGEGWMLTKTTSSGTADDLLTDQTHTTEVLTSVRSP